jgi:hypothetical protein
LTLVKPERRSELLKKKKKKKEEEEEEEHIIENSPAFSFSSQLRRYH